MDSASCLFSPIQVYLWYSYWISRAVDRDFAFLGVMILPQFMIKEASRGRERFINAFKQYYATGGQRTASEIIKARYAINCRYNISNDDIARFDLGVCTALLVNTVPAVFWVLLRTFSNRNLLDSLRQDIHSVVFLNEHTTMFSSTTTVSLGQIIKACPLLESLVSEVLRLHSNNASTRILLKDISVKDGNGGTYLLRKDSFLVVPSALLHNSKAVWGPTAGTFDPARFIKHQGPQVRLSANRTFGGGNALCPGRHFSMNEITSFLVIMLLKYDLEAADGVWMMPRTKHHISTSILTPTKDVWIRITPREGFAQRSWDFVW